MQELSRVQELLVHLVVRSVLLVLLLRLREYHLQLHACHVLLVAILMLVRRLVPCVQLAFTR